MYVHDTSIWTFGIVIRFGISIAQRYILVQPVGHVGRLYKTSKSECYPHSINDYWSCTVSYFLLLNEFINEH